MPCRELPSSWHLICAVSLSPRLSAPLQELGPRFTLKLEALQKGTFDSKGGEFEWVHKKEMDTSRRRFFL